jgi:hypothetical protein
MHQKGRTNRNIRAVQQAQSAQRTLCRKNKSLLNPKQHKSTINWLQHFTPAPACPSYQMQPSSPQKSTPALSQNKN